MKKKTRILAGAIATGVLTLSTVPGFSQSLPDNAKSSEAIRPFHVHVPQTELTDLRRRIVATRWPDKETVKDQTQGVQLATLQELVHYWGTERMGRAWDALMKRLGYTRYVAQGGDWGSVIAESMGRQAPAGLLAIHVNLPAALPPEIDKALNDGGGGHFAAWEQPQLFLPWK